jgi:Zn-dependent oligopeptidase
VLRLIQIRGKPATNPSTGIYRDSYNQGVEIILSQVEPGTATFQNIIQPIFDLKNDFCSQSRYLQFYRHASPNQALREATKEASVTIKRDKQESDISEYAKAVQANEAVGDPESRLFLQRQFKEPDRGRIKDINTRLEQIKVDSRRT